MTTPAWRGAMSMWLTEKPPRASPAMVSVRVVAAMPCAGPCAAGISISAPAAPANPAQQAYLKFNHVPAKYGQEHQDPSNPRSSPAHQTFWAFNDELLKRKTLRKSIRDADLAWQ